MTVHLVSTNNGRMDILKDDIEAVLSLVDARDQAPKLWRLNAWGDFQSPADATKVTVQADNLQTPFSAETLVGHQKPEDGCP